MRIVITGASGNIGTALLRRLSAARPEHELVGVVRRPPKTGEPYDAATWVALDLAEPGAEAALRAVLAGADAVVHLAWDFQPSRDTGYLDRVGVAGSRAVLAAADAAGVPHLVHMSSVGAYAPGGSDQRVDESWPIGGISSLAYSREKVAVERALDAYEARTSSAVRIARLRPGFVLQRAAGGALVRYGFPAYLPPALLRFLPLLPVDRGLVIPCIHSDDVADAVVRVLERRATGAFNLSAEPPLTRDDVAQALGARGVHVPLPVLRTLVAFTWRARLQPLDPGWLDLAAAVPLMDTDRARRELGWQPSIDSRAALVEAVAGMADGAGTSSPALRPHSVLDQLARLLRHGPVGERRLP